MEVDEMLMQLRQTRRALRWMAQGVLLSPSIAQGVAQALSALESAGLRIELSSSKRVLDAISVGLLPTQEDCLAVDSQVQQVMAFLGAKADDDESYRSADRQR